MNKVYRLVWSKIHNLWIPVVELTRSHKKGRFKTRVKTSKPQAPPTLQPSLLRLVVASVLSIAAPKVLANVDANTLPTGANITAGSATISTTGTNMLIQQQTDKLITNWTNFDIGSSASVTFDQPSSSSIALNRISAQNPTQIFGQLNANGHVMLVNSSGIVFSQGSQINLGAITASTLDINDDDFLSDNFRFTGSTGEILNQGSITTMSGGRVAFIAQKVKNQGDIKTPDGITALIAASDVTLDLSGDGTIGIDITQGAIDALVENGQLIKADNGAVLLSARALDTLTRSAVNNTGVIEATSITKKGGRIILEGDDIHLTSTSDIDASGATGGGEVLVGGDWQGAGDMHQATTVTMDSGATIDANATDNGDGGKVVLWSDIYNDDSITAAHGTINAKAGPNGGDGGRIETSGYVLRTRGVKGSTKALNGEDGLWLFDPYNIVINDSGSDSGGSFSSGSWTSSATSVIDKDTIGTLLDNGTDVTISTGSAGSAGSDEGDITVSSMIASLGSGNLTLEAADDVIINSDIYIVGGLTITASDDINLSSNITTGGAQTYNGSVVLGSDVSLSSKLTTSTATYDSQNATLGSKSVTGPIATVELIGAAGGTGGRDGCCLGLAGGDAGKYTATLILSVSDTSATTNLYYAVGGDGSSGVSGSQSASGGSGGTNALSVGAGGTGGTGGSVGSSGGGGGGGAASVLLIGANSYDLTKAIFAGGAGGGAGANNVSGDGETAGQDYNASNLNGSLTNGANGSNVGSKDGGGGGAGGGGLIGGSGGTVVHPGGWFPPESIGKGGYAGKSGVDATFDGTTLRNTTTTTSARTSGQDGSILITEGAETGSGGNITFNGGIDSTANSHSLTIDAGNGTSSVSGSIEGSGSLTKAGTGTLTLTGTSTYTGTTTVSAGTLDTSSGWLSYDTNVTVSNGATHTKRTNTIDAGDDVTKDENSPKFTKNISGYTATGATYTSNNTSVAKVNRTTGEVVIVGPGQAIISVSVAANSNYSASNSDTYTIKVAPVINLPKSKEPQGNNSDGKLNDNTPNGNNGRKPATNGKSDNENNDTNVSGELGNQGNDKDVGNAGGSKSKQDSQQDSKYSEPATSVEEYEQQVSEYNKQKAKYEKARDEYPAKVEAHKKAVNEYSQKKIAYEQELQEYNAAQESYQAEKTQYEQKLAEYQVAQQNYQNAVNKRNAWGWFKFLVPNPKPPAPFVEQEPIAPQPMTTSAPVAPARLENPPIAPKIPLPPANDETPSTQGNPDDFKNPTFVISASVEDNNANANGNKGTDSGDGNGTEAGAGGSDENDNTISGEAGNQGNDKDVGNAGGGKSTDNDNQNKPKPENESNDGNEPQKNSNEGESQEQESNESESKDNKKQANQNTNVNPGNQSTPQGGGSTGGDAGTDNDAPPPPMSENEFNNQLGGGSTGGDTNGNKGADSGDGNGTEAGAGGSDENDNTISGEAGNQGNDKDVGNAGGGKSTDNTKKKPLPKDGEQQAQTNEQEGNNTQPNDGSDNNGDKEAGAGGSDENDNTVSGELGNQGNDKDVGNAGGDKGNKPPKENANEPQGNKNEPNGGNEPNEGNEPQAPEQEPQENNNEPNDGSENNGDKEAGAGGSDENDNTVSGELGNQGNDKDVGNAGGDKGNKPPKENANEPQGNENVPTPEPEQEPESTPEPEQEKDKEPKDNKPKKKLPVEEEEEGNTPTPEPEGEKQPKDNEPQGKKPEPKDKKPQGNNQPQPQETEEPKEPKNKFKHTVVVEGDTITISEPAEEAEGFTDRGNRGGVKRTAAILLLTENDNGEVEPSDMLAVEDNDGALKATTRAIDLTSMPEIGRKAQRFVEVDYEIDINNLQKTVVGVTDENTLLINVTPEMRQTLEDRHIVLAGVSIAKERLELEVNDIKAVIITTNQ